MELAEVLHMNGGNGAASYAINSSVQREGISLAKPIREQGIIDAFHNTHFPKTFCCADLGCSSGPNSLLIVAEMLETIQQICGKLGKQTPEFQVYLNDLPKNDFNNILMSLPIFQAEMRRRLGPGFGSCFVLAVPGSFYGRLFPRESLHFIHSSYSLMWLSQVPKLTEVNKRNISLATTSPSSVIDAYYRQFQKDFCSFLKSRSQEVADGGCMVLTFLGRAGDDPTSKEGCLIWELLAISLNEMVDEGLIEEEKIDSFNIPQYTPSQGEVKALVEKEGSFRVNQLETSKVNWNACGREPSLSGNLKNNGYSVARCIRAVAEPLLSSMFEKPIIDEVFRRYADIIADHMGKETGEFYNVTISMTKIV